MLIIILLKNNGFAQQLLISEKSYSYPFVINDNSSLNPHVQKIVQRLKKNDTKGDLGIGFTIDLKIKITKEFSNSYYIITELSKKECPDGANYKGFDICSEFFPSGVKFNFEISSNHIKQIIGQDAKLKHHKNIEQIFSFSDSTGNLQMEVKPQLISLIYNQEWENMMNHKLNLIDLYYQSDSLFNAWDSIINSIHLEQIELLPINDFLLDEVEKSLEYYNNLNIVSIIDPSQEKHNQFKNRIIEINIKAAQKRVLLTEYLHWIDYRFIEKARQESKMGNPTGAIYNYHKALEYHPLSIQALAELSRIMLEQNNLTEASLLIKTIFTSTWPQGDVLIECRKVSTDIYASIVNQGDILLKEEEFHRAIQTYSIAYIFCDSIRENICTKDYYFGIVKSKYGIMRSYFNVINKALQRDLLEIAENYAREAKKYQLANQKEIPDDSEIQVFVDKIVSRYVQNATKNIDKGNFKTAIKQIQSADSLGKSFRNNFSLKYLDENLKRAYVGAFNVALFESQSAINSSNVLLADQKYRAAMSFYYQHPEWIIDTTASYSVFLSIRANELRDKIIQGNKYYTLGLFSLSLSSLQEAKDIETMYKFQSDTLLDSLLLAISKPLAFEKLNKVSMMIWRNELDESNKIIEEVGELIKKSKLENNIELMELYNSTKRKYEYQVCDYANSRINHLENLYSRSISMQTFGNALLALDSIKIIQNSFSRCVPNPKSYKAEYALVKPAALYESLIISCDIELRLKNVDKALKNYFTADSIYKAYKMNETGVFKKTLSSFFNLNPDHNLMIESCNWLLNSPHYENIIPLLAILELNGYPAKNTSNIQKSVAILLRNRDKLDHPSMTFKDLLSLYPVKSKFYYIFRWHYLNNPIMALFK